MIGALIITMTWRGNSARRAPEARERHPIVEALEQVASASGRDLPPLKPGTVIGGRHVLDRLVERTGGVEIYRASDGTTHRTLLVVTRRTDAAMARLELAALAIRMLGCRAVYEVGEMDDGVPFVVLDLEAAENEAV